MATGLRKQDLKPPLEIPSWTKLKVDKTLFFFTTFNNMTVDPQVPMEDLVRSAALLVETLHLRQHYMAISNQTFCATLDSFLQAHGCERPYNLERNVASTMVFDRHHESKEFISFSFFFPPCKKCKLLSRKFYLWCTPSRFGPRWSASTATSQLSRRF